MSTIHAFGMTSIALPVLASLRRLFETAPWPLILRFLAPPGAPASDTLTDKKDSLQRKESDGMEPSGLEPLTPCMPCRCSTS